MWIDNRVGMLMLFILFMHASSGKAATCPIDCKCSKNFATVSCAKKGLLQIPKNIPVDVTHLDLSNNLIQSITKENLRGLSKLEYLDFTSNKLENIENGSFASLASLKKLHLGKNRLTAIPNPERIEALTDFIFESNELTEIVFPVGFFKLTHLKHVTLTGNSKVTSLSDESFENLRNSRVTRLYMAVCAISKISNGTFAPLKHKLSSLQLSYNPLDGAQLTNALAGLNGSIFLTSMKLSGLKLDGKMPIGAFNVLRKSPIQNLDLSQNAIREINSGTFTGLPKLRNLFLHSCSIYRIENSALIDLLRLERLDLKNNSLSSVPRQLPSTLLYLDLSLNSNMRVLKRYDFVNLKVLEMLHVSRNSLVGLEESALDGLHKLHTLDLSGNQLSNIPKNVFGPLKALRFLFLNKNNFKFIQHSRNAPFGKQGGLVYLDLSENNCDDFPPNLLRGLRKLERLFLSHNKFGKKLTQQSYSSMFDDMYALKELHLSNNDILTLNNKLFKKVESLETLNLRNNKISHWSSHLFGKTKSLSSLDLSNNLISLVNTTSVQNFTEQLSLNLTGNPFACTCDLLWFRQWINETNFTFPGLGDYRCNSPHELQNIKLLDWHPDPNDCVSHLLLILATSIGGTVLVMSVVGGCTYRKRWFIRFSWYKLTHRRHTTRNGYRSIDDSEGVASFDAFLSFCDDDREWVAETLMKNFDGEESDNNSSNFKLCYDERDFQPNLSHAGSIGDSIENSRKLILVISDHYEFCGRTEFELHRALHQKMEDATFEIIVVLKDGPSAIGRIPRHVRHLVSSPDHRFCVEWPSHNHDGQQLFNRRLRELLEIGSVRSGGDVTV